MKDTLSNVSASPNQSRVDTLRAWLVRELARVLAISEEAIAINESFSRFGLDSSKAVELLNRLGEVLGRKIPVTVAWSHPTIEKLSNYLCGNPDSESEMSPGCLSTAPARNQAIAVIGLACRFPGAPDPGTFWEMLRSGRSAIREITPDRWDIEAWYDPDVNKPGKMNARRAGLLECIDQFDPGFFGISPREAVQMDPQQRLALELAWEALEDAGLRPGALRGSRTGLFVGVVWHDYETLARKAGAEITLHSGTGQAFSVVANRISYALGLQGPSIALDTACSSSLVSVHLACRSLQFGDATLAIAGGVNLIIDPATMVTLSKFGGLSPTGELCAFDARANGFVRGEGGGFVVLKPLSQALADGDPIYAVIRGTAANNDGASNGLTAPNPLAQQAVMREAYVGTGIRTADVQYVEAHGTGTQLGDPIEAQALGDVFGGERPGDQPLLVGSVKTNIGHLEGAAGIAGLIKLILSVKHRSIPPSLNFKIPNPHIDFAKVQVVTGLEPWPETTKSAIGGVSAFGWGGTNCHVVIEEPARSSAHLLPLSAPDTGSLQVVATELRNYLCAANSAKLSLADVCATAAARCGSQPERVALTARSLNELVDQLDGFLQGQKRPGLAVGHGVLHRPKLAFIFSPQGSQWIGMGKSLIVAEPVFRTKLVECERAVTKLAGWSLFDLLLSDESRLNGVQFIQPALAAIQIALAELWNSWGVRPDFVAAHSLGEWAAACVAGALTVEETMRIVVESSRAQSQADPGGGMAIVELPQEEVVARIREFAQEVFVSGQNSPTSTVVSGDAGRLKSLVADWKDDGLMCSLIGVDVAAHSPWMDPVLENLKVSLSGLHPTRTAIPLVSSVLGGPVSGTELGPEHWARLLREPVLFTDVIEQLTQGGSTVFLEISPHPLLVGGIDQILSSLHAPGATLGSCRRAADERESLLNSLGTLYTLGSPIDWLAVSHGGRDDLSLPIPESPQQTTTPINSCRETEDVALKREATSPITSHFSPLTSHVSPSLLPLSSHAPAALRDRARSVANYLRINPETSLDDVLHTLGTGREPLEYRFAVAEFDREKLTSTLETFARGEDLSGLDVNIGRARSGAVPRVAFVCSGQGPQWHGMGRGLLSSMPVFRKEIARCADEMKRHVAWDLLEELERDEAGSRLQETQIAQPALFALQVALAAVWRSWGIVPDALVGHSVGEIAAAYLSGALSFADAIMVVCCRGRLMQGATGLGRMAALEISETEAEKLLHSYLDRVSIGAVNSPTSIVVSGESAAIDKIVKAALGLGVRAKILPVDYAFHSSQMEPFQTEMAQSTAGLKSRHPLIPVYSTVTGAQATAEDFGPEYWGCNIRQTVRFATAVNAMLNAGTDIFVELSPHPVLSGMIAQCGEAYSKSGQQLPSLRRGVSEPLQLFRSLAALFAAGREVDWTGVFPKGGRVVPLPTYPWQRKRCRFEVSPASPRLDASIKLGVSATPIHGRRLHSPGIRGFAFETCFDATTTAFLQDHRVFGAVIVPAPMIIEMALSAASEVFSAESSAVTDFALEKPLVLSEDRRQTVQLVLDPAIDSIAEFKLHSADIIKGMEPVWTLHATGRLDLGRQRSNRQDRLEFDLLWSRCHQSFSGDDAYRFFERRGVHFGPVFRAVQQMALGRDEAVASLCLPEQLTGDVLNYRVHPVLLDAALQAIALSHIKRSATDDTEEVLWLFCGLDRLNVAGTKSTRLTCRVTTEPREDLASGLIRGSAQLYDENGLLIGEVRGAQFRRVTRDSFSMPDQRDQQDLLFEVAWQPWSSPAHALKREAPGYLPAVGQLEARLRTDLAKRCEELAPQPEKEVAAALHHLSAEYSIYALRELGWKAVLGDCFAPDELMQRLGIVSRHSKLVDRMLEMLCEEGVVQRAGDVWKVVCSLPVSVANTSIRDLHNRFPDYHAELDLFGRCAGGLPEVLRGRCDPLQLLFPEGSLESATHVYQDSPMSRAANGLVRELLQAAVEALPPGRVLRVLEIGAGTGGTTAHLLPLLKGVPCEYVFSDVSKLFLQSARQKLSEFPFVQFSLFDVEQPLESQGFAVQHFDVVVAANVLHATQDIRQSLARARSLLAPGGLLALVEGTQPTRWIDLVFGQTEGWWRFADTDLRSSHPLLSGEQWQQILMDSGFSEAGAIPAQGENRSSIFDQAVVLAKAPMAPTPVDNKAEAGVTSLDSPAQPERGAWLVFGDESPLCEAVVSALTNRGIEVMRIDRAGEFAILGQRHYRIDPLQTDQVRDAITATLASAKLPCRRAICLWGAVPDPSEPERVYRQTIALCEQALNAAQHLAASASTPQPSFWLVTCGAQPPRTSDVPAIAAASLWGLGRVLAVEHPEIWGGTLDLDPVASPQEHAEVIIAQAETPMGEDQCSFRGGVRFVPRLMPRAKLSDAETHVDWSAPGCYLITGGLGGIGLQIARWMASQGARRIVLIGRSALPPRSSWQAVEPGSPAFARVAAIREVEAFGAAVRTVAIDVADVTEIQRLLKSLEEEEWLPVLGVVHTAAVADDKLVANAGIESLERVFQPKALGALALEYCLAEQPLRFFICCSSVGALLGHAGQASYAASNSFLDAFVQRRLATKRPALGINWGGWYGVGLALTAGGSRTIKSLEQRGILGFKPAEGLLALNALLQCNCDQAVVIRIDWSRFRQTYPLGEEPPFLSALAARAALPVPAKSLKPATPPPKAEFREQLLALDSGEARRGMLESHLSNLLAAVLNLDPCAVDVEKSMGALGLDSLMGVELKNRCEQSFGLRLSATMVWNYPTIRALAEHLADKLGVTLSDTPPTADLSKNGSESVSERRFSNVLTSVEQLSEEDAINALIGGSRN